MAQPAAPGPRTENGRDARAPRHVAFDLWDLISDAVTLACRRAAATCHGASRPVRGDTLSQTGALRASSVEGEAAASRTWARNSMAFCAVPLPANISCTGVVQLHRHGTFDTAPSYRLTKRARGGRRACGGNRNRSRVVQVGHDIAHRHGPSRRTGMRRPRGSNRDRGAVARRYARDARR